jgi:hypothetical protein
VARCHGAFAVPATQGGDRGCTLMEKGNAIIPMVNDFLDAKSQKK